MTTNIILQARMSSSRLPNKVLKPLLGKAMLAHQLDRLQRTKLVDNIIVATSNETNDDAIAQLCDELNINCFRGSLDDVLDRYYQASQQFPSEHIVRITGDCPLIDPAVIDEVIALHQVQGSDYTSNCQPATFPDGLDVEVFTRSALSLAWQQAKKPSEREHVTAYIRNNSESFKQVNYSHHVNLSHYRWTVDEPEDFELIDKIYQNLYPKKPRFGLTDVLELLQQQPELTKINQQFTRNEGLIKSLIKDKELGYE